MSASPAGPHAPSALQAGGGTSDGMDARIAKLEVRIAHLPGKGFVFTSNMTAAALFAGVFLFSEKIKTLLGL
ncbi:MAG: hypothetical protein QOJ91_1682 [Sphingomonadales bacterium]|jgi:hypothetical protein|nr:hypothetical protein [Sphingomonadales bacterium]